MASCPKLLGRFVRALGRCALLGVCLLLSGALERPAAAEPIRPACSWLLGVTQGGGSGLFDLPLADPGCPWQLRLGAWGSGFLQYNFLLVDDRNEQISGAVQLGATLGPYIEAWLQIGSRANRNQRPATETSLSLRPTLALGRTAFGLKLHTPWGRLGHVAVQPTVRVHSGPFDFGPSFSSIDAGIDLLGSLDLSPIWPRLPLRLSGRVGYLHDRSDTLLASLDCMAQGSAECLATRLVYTTAYDVGQPRVELGLGADAHFRIGTGLYLGPAVSYRLAVVTGDGDPVLRAQLAMQGGAVSAEDIDARVAQMLTIGARMRLPWPVSIDLGMQIALSGWGYAMGPKLPQLSGYGALSFAIDVGSGQSSGARSETAAERSDSGAKSSEESAMEHGSGRVRGMVRDAASGTGLADAVVRFIGIAQNALITDGRGNYQSGPLPAGPLAIEASRGDHQTARVVVAIRPGELVDADFALGMTARPAPARLWLLLQDEAGAALPAVATLYRRGAGDGQAVEMSPQSSGLYARVSAGSWRLRIDAVGFLSREQVLVLSASEDRRLNLRLLRRPQAPRAWLHGDEILLAEALAFQGEPTHPQPTPAGSRLLDEVSDLLIHHPELRQVRIESVGAIDEPQLIAVRDYLVQAGTAPERVRVIPADPAAPHRDRGPRIVLRVLQ